MCCYIKEIIMGDILSNIVPIEVETTDLSGISHVEYWINGIHMQDVTTPSYLYLGGFECAAFCGDPRF